MRFIHLADLHIGKKVNEFSMLKDQQFVLQQVLDVVSEHHIDGIILAGDIYDKMIPSSEAVRLLDWFLTALSRLGKPVYMISGNHDSGERLAFGAKLMERSRIYVSAVYDGKLEPIVLEDEFGSLNLYLLPFIKPAHVRKALRQRTTGEENPGKTVEEASSRMGMEEEWEIQEIQTYQEAVETALKQMDIHPAERNVLVAHQLVTDASRCDSEDLSVGGVDNVDAAVFRDFDYVALGHIHGPQSMTRETMRYAGTLLKYSFSECRHTKSITVVDIREKGTVIIETIPVKPLHDMREIKGEYNVLMSRAFYQNSEREDYLKVVLTDEEEIPEALGKLRTVYPNIMKLEYDNARTQGTAHVMEEEREEDQSPFDYFNAFFQMQNNQDMNEDQQRLIQNMIEEIWEGEG